MYEHSELLPDQSFDPNDISWFQLWFEGDNEKLELIVDDETA